MQDLSPFAIVGLIIAVFWLVQFAQLMSLDDKSFPGTYDKIIWGIVFVFAAPLAPFAFLIWKGVYKSYKAAERVSRATERTSRAIEYSTWPKISKNTDPGNSH